MTTELLQPFYILGIEPTSDFRVVRDAYNRLIRIVHPDKNNMGWTKEECQIAFEKIHQAYKEIIKYYKFTDMPDYNIEYNTNNDDIFLPPRDSKSFDLNVFNQQFEQVRNKEKEYIKDPYEHGYKSFERPTSESEVRMLLEKDYDPKESSKRKNHNELIVSNPHSFEQFGMKVTHSELGLSKIDDYSFKSSGKCGLIGCDLQAVHGENKEFWVDTVARNQEKFRHYNDTDGLDRRLTELKSSRAQNVEVSKEPLDLKPWVDMKEYKDREKIQKNRDNFYALHYNLLKF